MKINFLSRKKISKEQLVDEIRSKLTKNGYKWEMHEGELLLTKNDNIFRVCFWGNHNNTIFRTYFVWHYSNEWLKQFEPWMLDLETYMTNREYPHTTSMMLAEDLYCCRFETAVCNAEDFLYDFEVANCRISEAVGYFFDRLHKCEKKNPIDEAGSDSAVPTEPVDKYPWQDPIERIVEKADNGDGESNYRLGVCYTFGLYGFEENKSKAVECYQTAVEANNYQAMFNLAAMYSNADGVPYNHDLAIELLYRVESESNNNELIQKARAATVHVNSLEPVEYLFK